MEGLMGFINRSITSCQCHVLAPSCLHSSGRVRWLYGFVCYSLKYRNEDVTVYLVKRVLRSTSELFSSIFWFLIIFLYDLSHSIVPIMPLMFIGSSNLYRSIHTARCLIFLILGTSTLKCSQCVYLTYVILTNKKVCTA